MKKIKLLYVVSTLRTGGPVNILFDLVRHLDKDRFELTVASLSPAPPDNRERDFAALGCQLVNFGCSHLTGFPLAVLRLRQYCRSYRPDLIHSHGLRPDLAALFSGVKLKISTLHNDPFLDYGYAYGKIAGYLVARLHLSILNFFTRTAACSRTTFEHLQRWHLSGCIQNGVDADRFHPAAANVNAPAVRWPGNAFKMLVVSAVAAGKNIPQIIAAGERLTFPYHLIVLGDGPLRPELAKQCAGDSRIEFRGHCREVLPYLRTADVYISASRAEGLPCSVMEAMLAGLDVVLSDIPSHRELAAALPETERHLFPLDDPGALADLLDRLRRRARPYSAEEMAEFARKTFSAAIMARKYAELYLGALT